MRISQSGAHTHSGLKRIFFYITTVGVLLLACAGCDYPPNPYIMKDAATDGLVSYPQKAPMRLLTDRAPQLETPLQVFKNDITPNEYFFVRWHLAQIVTRIDIDTFRLRVQGAVNTPLALSMNDLRTKFPADSMVALCICSGNSRSTFDPKVPGSQWGNGAMGNAKWKGVRLRDVLRMAGLKQGAADVAFCGMDKPVLPGTAAYVKSLTTAHALDSNVLIAYEMNGEPIPMLNGFPLKLVVPGWYASYWVGALGTIDVTAEKFKGFWMEKAYRITKDPSMSEQPDKLAKETVPLAAIKLHSIFVDPYEGKEVKAGEPLAMEGLVFNDGSGIARVDISTDSGRTWNAATLNPVIDKYSWRRWKYSWTPSAGSHHLCVRATDAKGHTQPDKQWNRSGYARGFIERITITAK